MPVLLSRHLEEAKEWQAKLLCRHVPDLPGVHIGEGWKGMYEMGED